MRGSENATASFCEPLDLATTGQTRPHGPITAPVAGNAAVSTAHDSVLVEHSAPDGGVALILAPLVLVIALQLPLAAARQEAEAALRRVPPIRPSSAVCIFHKSMWRRGCRIRSWFMSRTAR